MMNWRRWFNHIQMGSWQVNRAFPAVRLNAIEQTIQTGEIMHGGEVRFAVEGALNIAALRHQQTPHQRAVEVFSLLRMWDTEDRNGVLIYLLLADKAVEIIADRGVHARVGTEGWTTICQQMESFFRAGDYEKGVIVGIEAVNSLLANYYPSPGQRANELPNTPVIL